MTPDLDALERLATAAQGDGRWRDENTEVNARMDYFAAVHDPATILSLIEAARREAGLREALAGLLGWADAVHDEEDTSRLLDRLEQHDPLDRARALLHDNAGAAERGAG